MSNDIRAKVLRSLKGENDTYAVIFLDNKSFVMCLNSSYFKVGEDERVGRINLIPGYGPPKIQG